MSTQRDTDLDKANSNLDEAVKFIGVAVHIVAAHKLTAYDEGRIAGRVSKIDEALETLRLATRAIAEVPVE